MYKIALITTIALLGCGCTKTDPSYVTKEQGRKLSDSLTLCIESANKLTDKVNNHEARLATLETGAGVPASGSVGVTYVLNPNAPPSLTSTDTRPFTVLPTPAGANLASPVLLTSPASPLGFIQLPPCDLAVKFGEFKKGTELHLATLDDSRKKQDEKLVSHDTAIGELTKSLGKLTEKVDGFTQSLDQIKQEVQSLKPTPPPPAEAPSPSST